MFFKIKIRKLLKEYLRQFSELKKITANIKDYERQKNDLVFSNLTYKNDDLIKGVGVDTANSLYHNLYSIDSGTLLYKILTTIKGNEELFLTFCLESQLSNNVNFFIPIGFLKYFHKNGTVNYILSRCEIKNNKDVFFETYRDYKKDIENKILKHHKLINQYNIQKVLLTKNNNQVLNKIHMHWQLLLKHSENELLNYFIEIRRELESNLFFNIDDYVDFDLFLNEGIFSNKKEKYSNNLNQLLLILSGAILNEGIIFDLTTKDGNKFNAHSGDPKNLRKGAFSQLPILIIEG